MRFLFFCSLLAFIFSCFRSGAQQSHADSLKEAIAQTADAEAVALGNPNIHPSEGIVSPSVASGIAPIIVSW